MQRISLNDPLKSTHLSRDDKQTTPHAFYGGGRRTVRGRQTHRRQSLQEELQRLTKPPGKHK